MYIAYIYKPDRTVLAQIHGIHSVKSSSKLSDAWSGSFIIAASNVWNNPDILQEFYLIKLYKQDPETWIEKLLIDWYIDKIQSENNTTEIYIWDMIDFLKNRYLGVAKSYSWQTLEYILSDVLSDIHSRYDNWFILDSWVTDIISDKTYSEWQDILSIFKDLSSEGYEFYIDNYIISFKENIGVDRTLSWEDYIEYNFDIDNPKSRSIEDPKTLFNSQNISNSVKVKDNYSTETKTDTDSINKYGAIERFFTSSWNDIDTAEEILAERKESIREIEFTPITRNYFEVWIWDTVNIYIHSKNVLNNYIGPSRIIEKSYSSWDLENITLKTSTSRVKTLSFSDQIRDLKQRQKILEY